MWIQSHWIVDCVIGKLCPSVEEIEASWQPQHIVVAISVLEWPCFSLDIIQFGPVHCEDEWVLQDQLIGDVLMPQSSVIFSLRKIRLQIIDGCLLHFIDDLLLVWWFIIDHCLLMASEWELSHIRMESANSSKTVLFECSHINFGEIIVLIFITLRFLGLSKLIFIEILLVNDLILIEYLLLEVLLIIISHRACFLLLHLLILVRLLLVFRRQHGTTGCNTRLMLILDEFRILVLQLGILTFSGDESIRLVCFASSCLLVDSFFL